MIGKKRLACSLCGLTMLFLAGCDKAAQERAHERAIEAQKKADDGARKLGQKAKEAAREADQKIKDAVNGGPAESQGTGGNASAKLDRAGEQAHDAGKTAARKLDHAAMLAKVKTKLAAEVGMATVSNIGVDVSGSVVTLSGTVLSEDQKREAERVVSQVDGVTKVVNKLAVQP